MYGNQNVQIMIPRLTSTVKILLFVSVGVFLGQMAGERWFGLPLTYVLGFVPRLMLNGWVWQPFTYAFLHAGVFHLVFNLLILWSIGSELEQQWGSKFFLLYFFGCTVGAAITYSMFAALGVSGAMEIPVVGCSGAVYGMLLAYGILFGDRVLYFFMIFPMRAKYFVMILGAIVLISTVFYSDNGVAHTAHLGGMIAGLAILLAATVWKRRMRLEGQGQDQRSAKKRQKRVEKASHLRLVKGPEEEDKKPPKIWH